MSKFTSKKVLMTMSHSKEINEGEDFQTIIARMNNGTKNSMDQISRTHVASLITKEQMLHFVMATFSLINCIVWMSGSSDIFCKPKSSIS